MRKFLGAGVEIFWVELFWVEIQKNILGWKILGRKNFLGRKNDGSKKLYGLKNFGSRNFLGSENFFGLKKFLGWIFRPPIGRIFEKFWVEIFWGLLSNCTKSKKRDKVAEAYHYIRLLKHPTDRLLKHATNRLRSQATGEQMSDIATPWADSSQLKRELSSSFVCLSCYSPAIKWQCYVLPTTQGLQFRFLIGGRMVSPKEGIKGGDNLPKGGGMMRNIRQMAIFFTILQKANSATQWKIGLGWAWQL